MPERASRPQHTDRGTVVSTAAVAAFVRAARRTCFATRPRPRSGRMRAGGVGRRRPAPRCQQPARYKRLPEATCLGSWRPPGAPASPLHHASAAVATMPRHRGRRPLGARRRVQPPRPRTACTRVVASWTHGVAVQGWQGCRRVRWPAGEVRSWHRVTARSRLGACPRPLSYNHALPPWRAPALTSELAARSWRLRWWPRGVWGARRGRPYCPAAPAPAPAPAPSAWPAPAPS